MLTWTIEEKKLELKYTWKLSRNQSDFKVNFFVTVTDGIYEGRGEVAPNVRYGESIAEVTAQFKAFLAETAKVHSRIPAFSDVKFSSLRFGIESAYTHYLSRKNNLPVHQYLGIETPEAKPTAYTIPVMDPSFISDFYKRENLHKYKFLKVKLAAEGGHDMMKEVRKLTEVPIMLDANEAWKDVEQLIYFLEKEKKQHILFLEQPMPAAMVEEYMYLKPYSPFELFADESLSGNVDFDLLQKQFHGINIKLMKAGGYLPALKLLKQAKEKKMKTLLGCMVETTLGISSALNISRGFDWIDLDSFMYLKDEPFGLVKEEEGVLSLGII